VVLCARLPRMPVGLGPLHICMSSWCRSTQGCSGLESSCEGHFTADVFMPITVARHLDCTYLVLTYHPCLAPQHGTWRHRLDLCLHQHLIHVQRGLLSPSQPTPPLDPSWPWQLHSTTSQVGGDWFIGVVHCNQG
jgi:hypothetical protein